MYNRVTRLESQSCPFWKRLVTSYRARKNTVFIKWIILIYCFFCYHDNGYVCILYDKKLLALKCYGQELSSSSFPPFHSSIELEYLVWFIQPFNLMLKVELTPAIFCNIYMSQYIFILLNIIVNEQYSINQFSQPFEFAGDWVIILGVIPYYI